MERIVSSFLIAIQTCLDSLAFQDSKLLLASHEARFQGALGKAALALICRLFVVEVLRKYHIETDDVSYMLSAIPRIRVDDSTV